MPIENSEIMIYHPQTYSIPDKRMKPFIDPDEIWGYIKDTREDKQRVRDVIQASLDKKRLSLEETAVLINASDPELIEEINRSLPDNVALAYDGLHLKM